MEKARSHPDRHKLTQHLGIFPSEIIIQPLTTSPAVEAGDIFLLCTEGLTGMLEDGAIIGIFASTGSIEESAEALYDEALKNGGKDNITILIVQAKKGGLFK